MSLQPTIDPERFPTFSQSKSIAVVGDVMVDEFVFGDVSRVSPEAPVPVLKVTRTESRIGGAGNVAHNIKALGGECTLVGLTAPGDRLPSLLSGEGLNFRLVEAPRYTPIVKQRAVAQNQQLLRVDTEDPNFAGDYDVSAVANALREFDIIVVSDYAKGLVTAALMDEIRALNKCVLVDPKDISVELYRDVYLLKPNLEETRQALGIHATSDHLIQECATQFRERYGCNVLITRGARGMSLFEANNPPVHVPTEAREVYDVTGAGDTVIATIALALASDYSLSTGMELANAAAGIVVGKMGTSTTDVEELRSAMSRVRGKARSRQDLIQIVSKAREDGRSVVFTNGCFDILHVGHARLLREASSLGDLLVLGLNSDASVSRLKGPERPINSEHIRAEMLSCLESVDYVTVFAEDEPSELIAALKPDVHVKGGDYDPEDAASMPEAEVVRANGGRVVVIPLLEGHSTTGIISKLRNA